MTFNDELIQVEEVEGYKIEIYPDLDPEDPRGWRGWDNLGTMACLHKRYDLGDKEHDLADVMPDLDATIERFRELDTAVFLPIYMYDHSGIALSTSNEYPFNDRWDAGQVGWIYVTKEKVRKEWKVKRISKELLQTVEKLLTCEVEVYNRYVQGDVCGFVVTDAEGKVYDSCWGFYGIDEAVAAAKAAVAAAAAA